MKTRTIAIITFSILLLSLAEIGLAAKGKTSSSLSTKEIIISAGETQKKVFSLGGNIIVDGQILEDVAAIGGTVTINGEVGGSVVGIGSKIIIKSGAVIRQDVVALGGSLEKEPGCVIRGDTVYFQTAEISDRLFRLGPVHAILSLKFSPFFLVLKLVSVLVWAFLALIGVTLLPKQIVFASEQVKKSFWPTFAYGLLAVIIFTVLVLISALLCLVIIGIPMLISIVLIGLAVKIFGRLALFYLIGKSFLDAFRTTQVNIYLVVLSGLLLITLISYLPVLGTLISLGVEITGWGIAIRTKFGTAENLFRRS